MKRAKHLLKILDDHDSESIDAAAGIRRSGPLAVPLLLILAYASSLGRDDNTGGQSHEQRGCGSVSQ